MSYELFEQGPGVYVPVLLISLVLTMVTYGAFPLLFAKLRKAPITTKGYKTICFVVNFFLLLITVAFNGGAANAAPYFLWTSIFVGSGSKIMGRKGVLTDGDVLKDDPNRLTECKSCGYRSKKYFEACPMCGKHAKQYVYLDKESSAEG